jgi:hypothetical protein
MKRRFLLTFGVSSIALAMCPAADKPAAATTKSADPIVGRWRSPHKTKSERVVVFKEDGTCYYYYPSVSKVGGKWTVSPEDSQKYKVVWGAGTKDEEFRVGTDDKLRNVHGKIIAERYTE